MASAATIFVFARAITYATLFIGLVLVFLPAQMRQTFGADYERYCLKVRRWRPTL